MEDDDFLAAVEADNVGAPVAEEPVTPEPKPPEPAQPEPDTLLLTEPVTPPEPAKVEAPEPMRNDDAAEGRLVALLDTRDKLREAQAEVARLRESQQAQAQPIQMPDPYEDPEGFAAAQEARVSQALYQTNLRWSEQIASMKHGEETVKAAKEWAYARCDSDPYFNAKVAASPDPVGFAVTEYQREEIASKVTPDEFAQFQAWKQAQGQLQQTAQAVPPNTASTIPPRSLASAPSAGNMLTEPVQSDDEIFDEVIGKR